MRQRLDRATGPALSVGIHAALLIGTSLAASASMADDSRVALTTYLSGAASWSVREPSAVLMAPERTPDVLVFASPQTDRLPISETLGEDSDDFGELTTMKGWWRSLQDSDSMRSCRGPHPHCGLGFCQLHRSPAKLTLGHFLTAQPPILHSDRSLSLICRCTRPSLTKGDLCGRCSRPVLKPGD